MLPERSSQATSRSSTTNITARNPPPPPPPVAPGVDWLISAPVAALEWIQAEQPKLLQNLLDVV